MHGCMYVERQSEQVDMEVTHYRHSLDCLMFDFKDDLDVNQPASGLIRTSLMHLPNELLLTIFEDIDGEDAYSLSLLCRRLHYCALPIYLAKLGIHDAMNLSTRGEVSLFDSTGREALKGLRVALFITSIKRLICNFQFPEMDLFSEGLGLGRLLAKLTRVQEIVLHFHDLYWRCNWMESATSGSAFVKIMNDVVIAKSCSELVVIHHKFNQNPQRLVGRPRIIPFVMHKLRNVALSSSMKPSSSPPHQVEPWGIPTYHSAWLTLAPFLVWTAHTLSNSSITRLSLENTSMTTKEWSHILPCVNIPALVDLSLCSGDIAFADLGKFLARHASINYLKLSQPCELDSQLYLPITTLPRLKGLDASDLYIVHLLTPDNCFPDLVSVTASFTTFSAFDFTGMDKALIPVAHRINQVVFSVRLHVKVRRWKGSSEELADSFYLLHRLANFEICASWSWLQAQSLASHFVPNLFPMLTRIVLLDTPYETLGRIHVARFMATLVNTGITTVEYNGKTYRVDSHKLSP